MMKDLYICRALVRVRERLLPSVVKLASVCLRVLTTASTQVGVCNLAGEHADNQHGNLLHFGMPLGLRWICTRRRQVRVRERRPTCVKSFPSVLRLSRSGLCPADSAWKGVGCWGGFRKGDAQTHQDSIPEDGGCVGKQGGGNVKELAMQGACHATICSDNFDRAASCVE